MAKRTRDPGPGSDSAMGPRARERLRGSHQAEAPPVWPRAGVCLQHHQSRRGRLVSKRGKRPSQRNNAHFGEVATIPDRPHPPAPAALSLDVMSGRLRPSGGCRGPGDRRTSQQPLPASGSQPIPAGNRDQAHRPPAAPTAMRALGPSVMAPLPEHPGPHLGSGRPFLRTNIVPVGE